MLFMGKYTYQSTNAAGDRKYLTAASSQGRTYPVVAAGTAGETERWMTYQDPQGNTVLQMGDLFYLSMEEQVGWIVGDPSESNAAYFRYVSGGGGTVSLEVYLADAARWAPVFYNLDPVTPYLEFELGPEPPSGPGIYQALAQVTITPPLAEIQSSRNGRGYDFRNVDLSGQNLGGIDFTGADFTGAMLDGASFAGATLAGAVLVAASLAGTSVAGAVLDGADFTGANLSTLVWGQGISARKTIFVGCVGNKCRIGTSNPAVHADFTGAFFAGSDFTGSDFTGALFASASMAGGVFVGANFQAADFTGAQLGGLAGTRAAELAYAYLPNVVFTKANLYGVSFVYASLFGASTSIANATSLEQADFSNAYMEGIKLTGAALQGAKFSNACLVSVDFTGAVLSPTLSGSVPASLAGACLHGAIFTGATLTSADFTGATVSFANGTIYVQYCNPITGGPFPPTPGEPLNYRATSGLDLSTLTASTVCPNGLTLAANRQMGSTLAQMLTIHSPATSWSPVRCAPTAGEGGGAGGATAEHDGVILELPDAVLRTPDGFRLRDLRAITRDPEARRFAYWGMELPDARLKAMVHHYRLRQKRKGFSAWPAFRKSDRAFIGVFELAESEVAGGVEINVAVMPGFRGDPLVKELYRAVLSLGFSRLGLERILGVVDAGNAAALRFVDKIGFRYLHDVFVQKSFPFRLYEIRREDL